VEAEGKGRKLKKKCTYPERCGPLHTPKGRVKHRLSNAAALFSVALTVAEEFACESGGME
jgi:hypothetical protein